MWYFARYALCIPSFKEIPSSNYWSRFFFFPLHHPFLQLILMEVGMRSAAEHRKELKLESGNSVSGWIQILFFFFFKHPVRRSKLAYHTWRSHHFSRGYMEELSCWNWTVIASLNLSTSALRSVEVKCSTVSALH